MKRYFEKYKRFLGTIFLLWLFFWIAAKFGFRFAVEPFLLWRLVFFLGVIWVIGEIGVNWEIIGPLIKDFLTERRNEISPKAGNNQTKITAFNFACRFTGNFLRKVIFSKTTVLLLAVVGVFLDVFVFKFTSDLIILSLVIFWIFSVWRFRLKGEISVSAALVFLALCPFLLICKKDPVAEKAAVWAYMFLVVGVIQVFIENTKEEKRSAEKEE